MLRLPILPAEVTSPSDRFRCAPFGALLYAHACIARQSAATKPTPRGAPLGTGFKKRRWDLAACVGCADGATVRAGAEGAS